MRCISFCTANNYQLHAIADFFKAKHFATKQYRNVLHVTNTTGNNTADIFFFHNGCFVAWGLHNAQEKQIIAQIKAFSTEPLEKIESDRFIFRFGKKTTISSHQRFNADFITIDSEEADNVQIKLAISYGLAQSVKLEYYEESIQTTIDNHSPIPHELAKTGKISLSHRAISKRLGEIFLERSSVILKGEYFDVPEYFWRYSNLETYYLTTEKFLDIPKRVASLNHKLDVLHELFELLNNQLQHRYSSILETVIILLIVVEIVQNFIHQF